MSGWNSEDKGEEEGPVLSLPGVALYVPVALGIGNAAVRVKSCGVLSWF